MIITINVLTIELLEIIHDTRAEILIITIDYPLIYHHQVVDQLVIINH